MWLAPANGFQNHSRQREDRILGGLSLIFMGPDPIKGNATCAGQPKIKCPRRTVALIYTRHGLY